MATRPGHGWWPYIGPYLVFMVVGLVGERLPASTAPAWLVVKPALVAGCLWYFYRRGEYPELSGYRWKKPGLLADIGVGVLLAALWVVPYLWIPAIRPPDVDAGFDPNMLGAGLVPLVISLRMLGYGLVTPVFEELFMRSFVMRVAEVWNGTRSFREVPIAFFSWTSFIAVVVVFTLSHLPWEYWVMVPWAILSTLWFYYRGHLVAVIVLHAATNASILVFVAVASGKLSNGAGGFLPLWFFV